MHHAREGQEVDVTITVMKGKESQNEANFTPAGERSQNELTKANPDTIFHQVK